MKKFFVIMGIGEFSKTEYVVASIACLVFVAICGFAGWMSA